MTSPSDTDDSKWTKMMHKVSKLKGEDRSFFEAVVKSLRIDEWLAKDNQKTLQETRVLTLGGGNTGKTTLLKQLQILFASGFSNSDRVGYKYSVYDNILEGMLALIKALPLLGLSLEPQFTSYTDALHSFAASNHISTSAKPLPHNFAPPIIEWSDEKFQFHVLPLVKTLWSFSSSIRQCYARKNELPIVVFDSVGYFFDNIDRIGLAKYVPTEQDVLQMRVKTLGVAEHKFLINSLPWCFIDVAGQKTERRKWIHLFDGVSGVIFFVSLSSYDEFFQEEVESDDEEDSAAVSKKNASKPSLLVNEGLALFEELMNNRLFDKVSFTVFLNKMDIFAAKIKQRPLKHFLPDYTGPEHDAVKSAEHIKQMFLAKNKTPTRKVLVEFTCATDSSTIGQHILKALQFIDEEKRAVELAAEKSPANPAANRPPGLTRNLSDLSAHSISSLISDLENGLQPSGSSEPGVETVEEEPIWARESL